MLELAILLHPGLSGAGNQTQGFVHAGQVLYQLSHIIRWRLEIGKKGANLIMIYFFLSVDLAFPSY